MARIKEHGGLIDILSDGGAVIEPLRGKDLTVRGPLNTGLDAGSNDTYVIALSPPLTAYLTRQLVWFKANTANTGAATLNVNGLGAKTIKKVAGGITTDLATNDIRAGQYVCVVYDGTNFQMLSASGLAPDVAASILTTSITNGDTTHAPDGNSVFDALALKQDALTPGTFIADPTGGVVTDAEARTAIASILDLLIAKGLMAAS